MRMLSRLPAFDYLAPASVREACLLLKKHGDRAKVLAGGTDLLINMKERKVMPSYVVGLKNIPDLNYIRYSDTDGLRIGALATFHAIADNSIVREKFGFLAISCLKVGTPQIRNMGTIGGNLCNAGPSQDTAPSLLALAARLKLVSADTERIVPVAQFFAGPFKTVLRDDEMLTEIQIDPLPPHSAGCYHWLTKRTAVDETLVGVAALVIMEARNGVCRDIRLGLCSVAPTPIRAWQAEKIVRDKPISNRLVEKAAALAATEIAPRSRADYRRKMTVFLVRRAINEAISMIK